MKQSLDTRTKLLTKNPISLMIELSIPAVLGMVVVGLYNMMDSIFVGQMVGAAQMGAVSVLLRMKSLRVPEYQSG